MECDFEAEAWVYQGKSAWWFVTLPRAAAATVREAEQRRAFGMVKVWARVGSTTWAITLFKDTRKDSYLLALKAAVRKREAIRAGERIWVELRLEGLAP